MAYKLNTSSGYLHLDGHGGDSNTEIFDRADAADVYASSNDIGIKFCKTCFPDNPNSLTEEEQAAIAQTAAASYDPAVPASDEDEDE